MPNLELRLAEIEDLETLAGIDRDALYLGEHPFIEAMYQDERTAPGFQNKVQMWKTFHGAIPNERHFTVVDNDTGKLILTAKVLVPCSREELENLVRPSKLPTRFWDSEDARAWAQHMSERYKHNRLTAFRAADGNVFAVEHLAVSPHHQRLGAGSLFMEWITDQADEQGLECVVESSLRAEKFYGKHGFVSMYQCSFPPPAHETRWQDKATQMYVWMVRPAKSRE